MYNIGKGPTILIAPCPFEMNNYLNINRYLFLQDETHVHSIHCTMNVDLVGINYFLCRLTSKR